ncbi:MAG: hypothetical protein ACKVQT_06675 [Burkholderiales bacterium]
MTPIESNASSHIRQPARLAAPYINFKDASLPCLDALRTSIGFDLWMVTRARGNELVVLAVLDRFYGITEGTSLPWSDSLCRRMVAGEGPRIAPATRNIAPYADAGFSTTYRIAAYIGIPIATGTGTFVGTLCAFNPVAMEEDITRHEALIEASARMLATLLDRERASAEESRQAEQVEAKMYIDRETGIQTEPGWRELLTGEESRCAQLGHGVGVIVVSLDDLADTRTRVGRPPNDWVLRRGVEIVRIHLPREAIIARIGVAQLVAIVQAPDGEEATQETLNALHAGLDDSRIKHSMGFKMRDPRGGLLQAWREATLSLRPHTKRATELTSG